VNWIDRQKRAASSNASEEELLRRIESWKTRAQAAAAEHNHNQTKKALRDEPPTDAEAGAIYSLYAKHAETVFHVVRKVHNAYSRSGHADEPTVSLEDTLQEAYVLFQRALVAYEGERDLERHLRRAFRDRVQGYLDTRLTASEDVEDEPKRTGRGAAAGFSIPTLYAELVNEGKVEEEAARLFDSIHPKRN